MRATFVVRAPAPAGEVRLVDQVHLIRPEHHLGDTAAGRPQEEQEQLMRHTPHYLMTDPEQVKHLVRNNPWATFVSATSNGLVASHYPVLLDESATDITVLSHFGRPDDELHELGQHQLLVIIQGPHDYVSPSWYAPGELIPTWNHVTAHLYGTPVLLDEDENYSVLCQLTDHFERSQPHGRNLLDDEVATRRAARGTAGLRLRIDRFDARAKLSQNKTAQIRSNITSHLAGHNPALAAEMSQHPLRDS